MTEQQAQVPNLRVTLPMTALPPVVTANYFHAVFLGSDVELVFAFADIADMMQRRDAATKSGSAEFEMAPEVVGRVVMSAQSFPFLVQQIMFVAKQLGIPLEAVEAKG